MEFQDYYATLGVDKAADAKAIKQAYRRLARKYHPDVNSGDAAAETTFKSVTEAYEVLGDPDKRRKYDELGANWRHYEQAQAQGGANPFAGRWTVNTGGAAGGGFRTVSPEHMQEIFGSGAPFSDFFSTFFDGTGDVSRSTGRRGRDVESSVELSLEEAYAGTHRRLAVRATNQEKVKSVEVRIPAGVTDRARVRVKSEGERGQGGGRAGDLFLRVHVAPHRVFERRGADLYSGLRLPVTIAVLGGEVDVATIAGTPVRLRIPPLTQSGHTFRIRGYGMPTPGSPNVRGDAYTRVEIRVPTELSSSEQEHYQALAELAGEKTAGTHSAA
jgi:curved DNA-binding protein